MRCKKSMLARGISAGILSLFFVSSASAQEQLDPENGWYVGFSAPIITHIMGGFTGDKALIGPQDIIFPPDVNPGPGFGLTVGAREENLAFEFSYIRSLHRGKSAAGSGDVRLNLMNFDLKFFGKLDETIQPFFLVGGNIPRLFFEDGSVSAATQGRAKFSGFGVNLGVGAAYFHTPKISLTLSLTYRLIRYVSVSGVAGGARDIGSFSGDTISIVPKIMYSF